MKIKTKQTIKPCRCHTCRQWTPPFVTERQAVVVFVVGLVLVAAVIGAAAGK